jgi:hypothetical protein
LADVLVTPTLAIARSTTTSLELESSDPKENDMSDLMEGFTTEGVAADPGEPSFDQQLAAAAGKDDDGGSSPSAPEDPAETAGEAVVRGLLESGGDPAFEIKVTEPAAPAPTFDPTSTVTLSDGVTYNVGELDGAVKHFAGELDELDSFRSDEVLGQFEVDVEDGSEESFAEGLASLKEMHREGRVNDEQLTDAVRQGAIDYLWGDGDTWDNLDPEDQAEVNLFLTRMNTASDMLVNQRRVENIEAQLPGLIGKAADQRAVELRAVLTQFARDQGIHDKAHLEWRIRNAEATHLQNTGQELGDLFSTMGVSVDQMYDALAEADAVTATAAFEVRDREFKERLLGAGSAQLSEGLSYNGQPPVVRHQLGAPDPAKLNARVEAIKGRARYTTPGGVKSVFGDKNFSDGYTDKNGKSVKPHQIDGSEERARLEAAARRAASRF